MPMPRTTRSPGSTGKRPTATLVDFVAALSAFRKKHTALTHDHFLTGQTKNGVRDVDWLHPDGREMNDGDWNDAGASVLGMRLQTQRRGPDRLVQPPHRAGARRGCRRATGQLGLVSDDKAVVPLADGAVTLPPRSVVVLVKAQIPQTPPEVPPSPPQETPPQPEPPQPVEEPVGVPDNVPDEAPVETPPEETPREA